MKKIFVFMFFMFLFVSNVNAEACDAYDIKRLKEIAEGVEITYELQEPMKLFEEDSYIYKDIYKIKVSGLTEELILIDKTNDEVYNKGIDFNNKLFNGGKIELEIKSNMCSAVLRKTRLSLPVYNDFYNNSICLEGNNKELDVCQEWLDEKIDEFYFFERIALANKQKKNEKKVNYKFVIILISVMVIVLISVFVIKNKKGELK